MSFALKINIFNEIRCVDSTVIFVVAKLSGYLKDSDEPSFFMPSCKETKHNWTGKCTKTNQGKPNMAKLSNVSNVYFI